MTDADIKRNIRAATLLWMASVLLSRIMGFVREIVIARQAGASAETDVYFTAFTIPDFVNYMLAGSALSITFIPIFAAYLADDNEAEGWRAFSAITTFIGIALAIVIVVTMIAAPELAPLVAKGFSPEQQAELVRFTRIILPAQLFHFEGFLLSAVQMAKGQHKYPALSPLVYNGGTILGGLLLGSTIGMEGFCWGVLGGAFFGSFLLQMYGASKVGMKWRPNLDFRHPGLVRYVKLSLPIMIGQSLIMWDEWLIRHFGSFLSAASISWLNYGRKLALVPQAVFAQATGTASYPHLARQAAEGHIQDLFETLSSALRSVLLLALSTQVFLMVLAPDICYLLFRSAQFGENDVAATSRALFLFSLGIAAWSVQGIIARGYYAFKDTITPTVLGTLMTLLSVPLYRYLSTSLGYSGLALGSTLMISLYALLLYAGFIRKIHRTAPELQLTPLWPFLARVVAACAVATGAAWITRYGLLPITSESSTLARWLSGESLLGDSRAVPWTMALVRSAAVSVVGSIVLVISCVLFGLHEILDIIRKIAQKTLGAQRAERLLRRFDRHTTRV